MSVTLAATLLLAAPQASAHDEAVDVSPALVDAKKPKWDPKGKALEPFARAKTQFRNKQYAESIPGFIEAVSKRPGCGECLDYLASALYYDEHYDEAIQVGEHLEALYPDKTEGPDTVRRAYAALDKYAESTEAIERILKLEDMAGSTTYWWARNFNYISLGQLDTALEVLEGAADAGVKDADAACLRVQVMSVNGDAAGARELWDECGESKSLELKRSSEGWLALAEGDTETAAKRLMLAGAQDYARVAIAFARIEAEEYEAALNLANKFLEDNNHVDGHLAKALALHGLGKDDEAVEALEARLLGDSWKEDHGSWTLQNVLLKSQGQDWPKSVGRQAVALRIAILAASGDAEGAKALYDEAVAVHGEHADLTAALEAGAEGEGEGEDAEGGDKE